MKFSKFISQSQREVRDEIFRMNFFLILIGLIYVTGKPAIMVNSIRYTVMSETSISILWRCSYMATKSTKCSARIIMTKQNPPVFAVRNGEHRHAEIKRGKYVTNPKPIPIQFISKV